MKEISEQKDLIDILHFCDYGEFTLNDKNSKEIRLSWHQNFFGLEHGIKDSLIQTFPEFEIKQIITNNVDTTSVFSNVFPNYELYEFELTMNCFVKNSSFNRHPFVSLGIPYTIKKTKEGLEFIQPMENVALVSDCSPDNILCYYFKKK